jgi:hypothetical protein
MDLDALATFTQFGTAGLIGWMWLTERRAAMERDRQLAEQHERLMQERRGVEIAVEALRENTRVLAGVEASQRSLAAAVERLVTREARAA